MRTPTKATTTSPQPNDGPPFAAKVMALRMILAWIQRRDAKRVATENEAIDAASRKLKEANDAA